MRMTPEALPFPRAVQGPARQTNELPNRQGRKADVYPLLTIYRPFLAIVQG